MNSDLWHRVDSTRLYQPFKAKVDALLAECVSKGATFFVISAYRSVDEQDALYAQGRTKPGAKVTNARGGESCHSFAIAVDLARDADASREGLQPTWVLADYAILKELAPKYGLVSGMTWHIVDAGHIEFDLPACGLDLHKLKAAHDAGGMPAVFALIEQGNA